MGMSRLWQVIFGALHSFGWNAGVSGMLLNGISNGDATWLEENS